MLIYIFGRPSTLSSVVHQCRYGLLAGIEAYSDKFMTPIQIAEAASLRGLRPELPKAWPEDVTSLFQVH